MGLTLRSEKKSKLTHAELDGNFLYLKQFVEDNLPPSKAIDSGKLAWQEIEIRPGRDASIIASPFLNLNLNTSAELWVDGAFVNGINNDPRTIIDGSFGFLKNISDLPILLKNNDVEDSAIPFNLSVNSDYVLKPNAMVSMVYSSQSNRLNVMCLDSISVTELTPKSDYYIIDSKDVKNQFIHIKLSEVPSLQDHIMIFYNGKLIDDEAIIIEGDAIAIDQNVIGNHFEEGFKLTIKYKHYGV